MKIVVDNVTKTFGNTNVIEDVSMQLESGRVYGFQGINGCG
jgi:ABC-2 type transport system ATP-binding protein